MSSENNLKYLPYFTEGKVVRGFGRGGAELGIPTDDVIARLPEDFVCGVYYGWACVNTLSSDVYKMVMCCGWNTHFHNTVKTMETHIMHKFSRDFYGENLRIIILGYIRPMEAYDSLDALIRAVNNDIQQSEQALSQPTMMQFSQHGFLTEGSSLEAIEAIPLPNTDSHGSRSRNPQSNSSSISSSVRVVLKSDRTNINMRTDTADCELVNGGSSYSNTNNNIDDVNVSSKTLSCYSGGGGNSGGVDSGGNSSNGCCDRDQLEGCVGSGSNDCHCDVNAASESESSDIKTVSRKAEKEFDSNNVGTIHSGNTTTFNGLSCNNATVEKESNEL